MANPLSKRITLNDLRAVRHGAPKMPMLTCYDFTNARLMQQAGVPALLVGDSAANVILGYDSTIPVSFEFMVEITAAVRRGAPLALVIADMPFGSYQESVPQGIHNVCRMLKESGADAVKLEVSSHDLQLISALAAAGVAVIAHLGLRPQSVKLLGDYKFQGRTAIDAQGIVASALQMQTAGAAAVLLEAVPPEVSRAVIEQTSLPVIGCGAGPACHSSVIVTHDALGLTTFRPRFAPTLAKFNEALVGAFQTFVDAVVSETYPADEHNYVMAADEKAVFEQVSKK